MKLNFNEAENNTMCIIIMACGVSAAIVVLSLAIMLSKLALRVGDIGGEEAPQFCERVG
jgi:hypothetical protein